MKTTNIDAPSAAECILEIENTIARLRSGEFDPAPYYTREEEIAGLERQLETLRTEGK